MKVCIAMIENELHFPFIFKEYHHHETAMNLTHSAIYCGEDAFAQNTVYITYGDKLPENIKITENAALICIGEPPVQYFHADIPLIILGTTVDLFLLSNEVNRIFNRYNILELKLQEGVYGEKGFQYMVDLISPFFENEVLIMNSEFCFIAHTYDNLLLNSISELPQPDDFGRLPLELVDFFKNDIHYNDVQFVKDPFIYQPSIFPCRTLCINVFYQEVFACRIVSSEIETPFKNYHSELLRFFAEFIKQIYYHSSWNKSVSQNNIITIFYKLLDEKTVEPWELEKGVISHGWEKAKQFMCACLLPTERDFHVNTLPYYRQIINRNYSNICAIEYKEHIVCIVKLQEEDVSGDQFISKFIYFLRESYFRCGFSNTFSPLSDLKSYYLQSLIALNMGISQKSQLWYYRFSNHIFSYISAKLSEDIKPRYLCAKELTILEEYDSKNHSDYLLTLRVYLNNQMNAVQTAKELFIHRSTMMYRLERIKELTNLNLKDPTEILYLQLSLKLFF